MYDLVERVKATLVNPNDSLWFPELAAELTEKGWQKLNCVAGLSRSDYGTARVITRDAVAPRRIVALLPIASSEEYPEWTPQVEVLDKDVARKYEEVGIKFYSAEELERINVLEHLETSIDCLKRIPSLFRTVAALVRSIHVIKLDDDDYDVSFSEPHIPFSIFVSVPQERNSISPLRVAEAIVHEAMHLQLTLIDLILPLSKSTGRQYYSPWREELRSVEGVIHGLYVFCVVDEVLRSLFRCESAQRNYVERRLSEIHAQIESVESIQESTDLTEVGTVFIQRLLSYNQQKSEHRITHRQLIK